MKSRIVPIKGDASFRTFYRLRSKKNTKIIVHAKKEKFKNLIAYSAINQFLRNNKILAPKLYEKNIKKGIIIIEDFGDITFYKLLLKKKNRFLIYKKIIDLLVKIQKIRPKLKIKSVIKKNYKIKKYTNKFLHQETDLFFDWYLPLILNRKVSSKIKKKTKKILTKIYNRLNFPNSYFVHRDFHVQNLMKVKKKIGVIDSQDAIIGNPAYDLVSLIDDVRIKNSPKLKKKIYNYYLIKSKNKLNKKKFLEDFQILSVQRNLKIIGIFSRLFHRDKKKQYVKFIPNTWKLLEKRMNADIFLELKKIVDDYIPKKFRNRIAYK